MEAGEYVRAQAPKNPAGDLLHALKGGYGGKTAEAREEERG